MKLIRPLLAIAALAAMLAAGGTATAKSVHAPLGYQLMCLKTPAECKGGGKAKVEMTEQTMAILKRINLAVNRAIRPKHDGSVDVWTANGTSGDCEDYALSKRHQLIKAGLPASSLRIAYVKTRSGEGHAILVVNTAKGKVVLDNLTNAIKPLHQTGYRLLAIQGGNPAHWS